MSPSYTPLRSNDLNQQIEDNFWEKRTSRRTPLKLGAITLIVVLFISNIFTIEHLSSQKHKQEPIPRDYGEDRQNAESRYDC